MTQFRRKAGSKSAYRTLRTPISSCAAFAALVRSLIRENPLGCLPYRTEGGSYPAIRIVREMYTARFLYLAPEGKRVGSGSEVYNSEEGYETGIAAVISNMANIASHRGKVKHCAASDRYAVLLRCHDAGSELYFISMARDRLTVSSYIDDEILRKVESWADSVPALG